MVELVDTSGLGPDSNRMRVRVSLGAPRKNINYMKFLLTKSKNYYIIFI